MLVRYTDPLQFLPRSILLKGRKYNKAKIYYSRVDIPVVDKDPANTECPWHHKNWLHLPLVAPYRQVLTRDVMRDVIVASTNQSCTSLSCSGGLEVLCPKASQQGANKCKLNNDV